MAQFDADDAKPVVMAVRIVGYQLPVCIAQRYMKQHPVQRLSEIENRLDQILYLHVPIATAKTLPILLSAIN